MKVIFPLDDINEPIITETDEKFDNIEEYLKNKRDFFLINPQNKLISAWELLGFEKKQLEDSSEAFVSRWISDYEFYKLLPIISEAKLRIYNSTILYGEMRVYIRAK